MVSQFSNSDQTTISIIINGSTAFFTSLYLPYEEQNPITEIFLSLQSHCNKNKIKLYIGADANAHHTSWGSSGNNSRGIALYDALNILEMNVTNIGKQPTFVTEARQEVIDITITNKYAVNTTNNWKVSEIETYSDHKQIEFNTLPHKTTKTCKKPS